MQNEQGDGSGEAATQTTERQAKSLTITIDDAASSVRSHIQDLLREAIPGARPHEIRALGDHVLKAATEATTLNDANRDTTKGPSRRDNNRTREGLDLALLENTVNTALLDQSRDRLPRKLTLCVDLTNVMYHGTHHEHDTELRRTKAQDGTTWCHTCATAYVAVNNRRYTVNARYLRKGDTATKALRAILDDLQERGFEPDIVVLLIDPGFCTVQAVKDLKARDTPFIIPRPLKGKRTKALCCGRGSHYVTYQLGEDEVRVAVVVRRNGEQYHGKRKGNVYFPYIVHGLGDIKPQRVDKIYRKRGGIETSYAVANECRARTSSQNAAIHLLNFAVSFILENAWVSLSWMLSAPQRGHAGRWRPKGFFPFRQFLRHVRAWFEKRYGFKREITQLPPRRSASLRHPKANCRKWPSRRIDPQHPSKALSSLAPCDERGRSAQRPVRFGTPR